MMSKLWDTMWGKLIGTVLGFFTIAAITGTWFHMTDFWEVKAAVITIEEGAEKQQETLSEILKTLVVISTAQMEINGQIEDLKVVILTPEISGRATVGSFGSEDSFVDVNEHGKASMYIGADNITLTYSMNGITRVVVLIVRGSFRNRDDDGHLIMLSARAGDDLGVSGIVDGITVGPVKK